LRAVLYHFFSCVLNIAACAVSVAVANDDADLSGGFHKYFFLNDFMMVHFYYTIR